jgi:hypothetical protein
MKFVYNIYLIAKYQKGVEIAFWTPLFCLLPAFFGFGFLSLFGIRSGTFYEIFSLLTVLGTLLLCIMTALLYIRVIMLLKAMGEEDNYVFIKFLLLLIPFYNLFVLLDILKSASGLIRDAGFNVGFFGVCRSDLKTLKTIFPHRLKDSIDEHEFSPFVEQYPEIFQNKDGSIEITNEMREQIKGDQARGHQKRNTSAPDLLFQPDGEKPVSQRKILVIIDADPRTNARAVEALRTVGGVGVWQQVEISVVLRHAAARALGGSDLFDGNKAKQFVSMVRENSGRVYLMPDSETMEGIDATELVENTLKEPELAELAAQADYVMRF